MSLYFVLCRFMSPLIALFYMMIIKFKFSHTTVSCIINVLFSGHEIIHETIGKPRESGTSAIQSHLSLARGTPNIFIPLLDNISFNLQDGSHLPFLYFER